MILKKVSKLILSCSLIFTSMIPTIYIEANTDQMNVTIQENLISVGNDFIERSFQITDRNIITSSIKNKRIDSTLIPASGSQDFVINILKPAQLNQDPDEIQTVLPKQALNRSKWKATIKNSTGNFFPLESVHILFDGDVNTYPDEYMISGHPITLDIDLGTIQTIRSFSIDKRCGDIYDHGGINGTMGQFELFVSNDGINYKKAGKGEFTADDYNLHEENDLYNVGERVYANFDKEYRTRYVRIIQKSVAFGSYEEFTSSEINIYSDIYIGNDNNEINEQMILSSELIYKNASISDYEDDGKRVVIEYEPIEVFKVNYNINQVLVVKPNDHYIRSFLEISVDHKTDAIIDYIDIDRFVLSDNTQGVWSHPDESNIISSGIGRYELMLGQPIYVEGMFMGSEFPATDTDIDSENTTQVRYYSGKSFDRLDVDHQLREDGTYVTWPNVIGSATGKDISVVQTAFFEYIDDIATPTQFRKQYNSWYDNMMNITDDSIANSFYDVEKGLTQNGIEPLDSYVIDDGWNNYYDGIYTTIKNSESGTIPNQTGFWEFNAKFPNELYTSSALANKFASTFGLWLGPQGGYSYNATFAQFLEASGTGYAQDPNHNGAGTNICVSSTKYVNNLKNLFIDYQNRFDVDYWKWDGFMIRPCTNETHDHMVGGYKNMYHTSDQWEKWIDLFETVRAAREKQGKGLFINATCFVHLSPWLLQWVNTVWIQNSSDSGELPNDNEIADGTSVSSASRHQRKIYYRDDVYYLLYKQNQIQFPMKNIYNHDPIYGISDYSNASDDVFRQFLFANAVRGTSFWELYYSPSLMNEEKWDITSDALQWAQENFHILQKAKWIGGRPQDGCLTTGGETNGVYGYSSWNDLEGILAVTNPSEITQTFSVVIDDKIGVSKKLQGKTLNGYKVLPNDGSHVDRITYGDTLTIEVPAHQTVIYQYGKNDINAPMIDNVVIKNDHDILLRFNERIVLDDHSIRISDANGELLTVRATLQSDYRSVVLTTDSDLPEVVRVCTNIKDVYGNISNEEKIVSSTSNGILYEANFDDLTPQYDSISDITWYSDMHDAIIENEAYTTSMREFTIRSTFKVEKGTYQNLVDLGDAKLEFEDDVIKFTVGNQSITSKEKVMNVIEKAHGIFGSDEYVPTTFETSYCGLVDGKEHIVEAVREANGMLKIYFDGMLVSAGYDETQAKQFIDVSTIKVGDTNFDGFLSNVQILNYAISYDETTCIENKILVVKENREGWRASACSEMPGDAGDASASAAIDGNNESWWHTNYGESADTCEMGEHWIQINFGKDITFDHVLYIGRGATSNGSIKGYSLQAKNANGKFVKIKEGQLSGKDTISDIQLEEMITTDAIKLIPTSTHNGNNFASAVEIYVGTSDIEFTNEQLLSKKNEILDQYGMSNEDLTNYSTASANNYKKVYNKITNVTRASAETFKALVNELEEAKESLVNVMELREMLADIDHIDFNHKTPSSIKAVYAARRIATNLLSTALTTNEINEAMYTLEDALSHLTDIASKVSIDDVLAKCHDLNEKDYTKHSWTNLQYAIILAQEVKNDDDASIEEVENIANEVKYSLESLVSIKHLQEYVNELKNVNLSNVSEASKDTFEEALSNAEKMLKKSDASEEEIASALSQLSNAYQHLVIQKPQIKIEKVKDVIVKENTYSSVIISWKQVDDACGYEIVRSTSYDGSYGSKIIVDGDENSVIVNQLKTGQKYFFKVRAIYEEDDEYIYGSYSSRRSAMCKMHIKPVLVSVKQKTYGTLQVTWKGVAGAHNYYLERRKAGDKNWKHLKTFVSSARSGESRSLDTGTKYEYRVRCSRYKGEDKQYSDYSNIKGNIPMMNITSLSIKKNTSNSIKLSWQTVSGANGYEIYRATSSKGKYVKIKTLSNKYKSLICKSLVKGKTYYYKVRAYRIVNGKKVYNKFSKVVSYRIK